MKPGTTIADRYVLIKRVGAGGMGTIFKAEDRREGRLVALKILRGDDATDIERFVREAAILAELDHPNIVRYAGHGVAETGEHYLAMEWLDGEDLSARIARLPLTDHETLTIMRQAIAALTSAHERGAVHRDIKPSNLFLRGRDVEQLAIVDFGVAGIAGDFRRLTQTGMLLGTPGYMAPEQVEGPPTHDTRSDIFSLGCVFFECLTGRPAFEGTTPMAVLAKLLIQESPRLSEIRPEIPELDELVSRMLAKSPSDRPQSLAEVAVELDRMPPSIFVRTHRKPSAASAMATTLHSIDPAHEGHVALGRAEQRLVTVVLAGDPKVTVRSRPAAQQRVSHDLGAAVEPYGGHLTPLAGGAMIVTMWTPGTALDRAERAALCALALRDQFPEIPITIATGRGPVAARVVEGDVIDRAARALTETPPGVVSLDDATAGMLPPRLRVERNGERDGDGFVLRGAAPAADGIPLLLGKATPCLGRNREMAMLEGIFTGAIAEPVASAVLVTGPAGSGKSRLRRELVERLKKREEPVEVLMGRADSLVSGSPYGVLADVIRNAAGIREGEPLEVRRKKLMTRLARTVREPMLQRVATFLGEMISTPFPDDTDSALVAARHNAMLMGDAMRNAWEEWLTAECNAHPVLLVLEDLQWGDAATARLVDSTPRNLRDLPLVVLALARPEAHGDLLGAWMKRDVPVIRLGPLPTRASERLVREALGTTVSDELVRRIVDRAAGNPFYLEELIRAVDAGRGEELPDSVLGTVEVRLDAEGADAKRALRAASVFGDRFWVGGVSVLLGGERHVDEARRVFVSLAARELVAPSGAAENEYVFCNTLVRQAAYATLTESDRVLGHRLAGDWLERTSHTDAMAMAEHFRRGNAPDRAVRWYRRAAEQALEANELGVALDRCRLGLDSGATGADRGALRLVQAEAQVWRGELEAAEASGLEAISLLEEGIAPWFRAVHHVVIAASKHGRLDRVKELFTRAGAVVPARGARSAQIVTLAQCPGWFIIGGDYETAEQMIAAVDHLAADDPTAIDAEGTALLHQMHAAEALVAGDHSTEVEQFTLALAAFEAAADQRNATTTRVNLGARFTELGDFEGAEAALRAALAGAERMGLHDNAMSARANLGYVLAYRGNLSEARDCEQNAIEAFQRHGDERWEGISLAYLAKIALFSGDLSGALRSARKARDLLAVAPPLRPLARAIEAQALLGLGEIEAARAVAQEAFDALTTLGTLEEGEALVRLVHAETLAAAGAKEAFREAITRAKARLLERAAKIKNPEWRERFLQAVPDHARTLALADSPL